MGNEVEIRFSVKDDTASYRAASHNAGWRSIDERSERQQSFETQAERIANQQKAKIEREFGNWQRMSNRFERRLTRMGARMIGAFAAEEIGQAVGASDSVLGRMTQSGIQGAMIGGPQGAAISMAMALIREGIEAVKKNSEDIQAMKARILQFQQEEFRNRLDFVAEERRRMEEMELELERSKTASIHSFVDHVANSEWSLRQAEVP